MCKITFSSAPAAAVPTNPRLAAGRAGVYSQEPNSKDMEVSLFCPKADYEWVKHTVAQVLRLGLCRVGVAQEMEGKHQVSRGQQANLGPYASKGTKNL